MTLMAAALSTPGRSRGRSNIGDEVLYGWRSFEIYPLQVRTAGATPVQVPLTDHTYDLDAMLAAITDRTRLIFVCNPNNPTSTVVDPEKLARFIEAVPSDILIALDEAYVEYIRDGLLPDSFGLVRAHPNVVVLRTFSKAYGLAGIAHRLRRRRPGHHHRAGQGLRPFHRDQRLAGRGHRIAGRRRRAAGPHRRRRRRTRPRDASPSRRRLHRAAVAGQLRLAATARTRAGVCPRRGRQPDHRAALRRGRRACHVAAAHENDMFLEFARSWMSSERRPLGRGR